MPYPTKKLEVIVDFQNGLWTGKKPPFVTAKVLRNTNFKNNDGSLNYDDVAEIGVEEKQLENRLLQKGDIILERSGGGPDQPVGRVVYFNRENDRYSFSNFTTRIRVNSNKIDDKYLWFFLYSFYKSGKTELMQKKTTGIRNLIFSEYKQIEIPLPPMEIQKKIVKKIEELFAKITQAQSLRESATQDTDDLIPAALSKTFTEIESKGRNLKKLVNICQIIMGQSPPSATYNVSRKGLPFYQGKKDYGEVYPTPRVWCSDPVKIAERNDILISVRAPVGTLNISAEKSCIGRGLAGVRAGEKINFKYLYYFLRKMEKEIASWGTGSTFTAISKKHLENIIIPLPPISEQRKIASQMDALTQKVRELQTLQSQTVSDLTALKQSILHQAFQGEL